MKAEFTAIIEPAEEGGFWAVCPEVPGANGQGETIEETKQSLKEAMEFLVENPELDALLSRITSTNQHSEKGSGKRVGKENW